MKTRSIKEQHIGETAGGTDGDEVSTTPDHPRDIDTVDENTDGSGPPARRSVGPWRLISAALLIAGIAGALFGYLKISDTNRDIAAIRQAEADRSIAAQTARDYAQKSLTYSFEDPDAFFGSVEEGVSQPLKDKYINAKDLLKGIMLQAQVVSSGEVLATDVSGETGGVYQVVVAANQSARNLQNPEPHSTLILLQITVNKIGDSWQVTDIGPKAGSQPDQIPAGTAPMAPR